MGNIKKFEDFLDKMRGLLDNAKKQGHIIVRVEDIENTFPELKESEDEQIRKEIIEFLRLPHRQFVGKRNHEKWIVWLEKQGKETSWKPSKEEMDVLYGLAYITNQYDEHKEEVITRLYQDLKREFFNGSSSENMFPTNTSTEDDVRRRSTIRVLEYARSLDAYNQFGKADIDKNIAWLEKQGEQKVNYTASVETGNGGINALVTRELTTSGCDDSNYCSDCTNDKGCINCENGDMKEAEHKTEPKFKVGNWYQCTKDFFGKGVTFDKNTAYYCAIEGCLQGEYGCHIAIVKDLYDNFKLWDITKDVKEGDVLIGIYGTFIFMGENNGGYCGVLSDNTFIRGTGNNDMTKGLHPATKEQRDALLKALADAGWEFDFEKKELKKIEQKPVSITDEWIEDYWQHEKVNNPYSHDKGEEIQFDHQGFVRFCKKYCKKPTAWGEGDERLYRGLQGLIYSTPYCNSRKKISDWLKSLKDRVIPLYL